MSHRESDRVGVLLICTATENKPLCENCRRHFTNLVSCDFDDQEPVVDANAPVTASAVAGPSRRAAAPRATTASQQQAVRRTTPVGREAEPLRLPPSVSGRVDPFEARPISFEAAPTVDELMHHCTLKMVCLCES